MCVCVCFCTKGCVIYLSNVRVLDNATAVSRLALMVAMVTLANRSHRSLREERRLLETEKQRGVFVLCLFILFSFFASRVVGIDQELNPCCPVEFPNALSTQTREGKKA